MKITAQTDRIILKNFKNVVYLPEYDISLIKVRDRYIQVPNEIKMKDKHKIDPSKIKELIITPYMLIFNIAEKDEIINGFTYTKMAAYVKKINININLHSGLYKIFGLRYRDQFYPLYIINKDHQFDNNIIERIVNKIESLDEADKLIILNRLMKNSYDTVKIMDVLNKDLKKKNKQNETVNIALDDEKNEDDDELLYEDLL